MLHSTHNFKESFMPIQKAASKAMRQAKKHRLRNLKTKSELKTLIRKLNDAIIGASKENVKTLFHQIVRKLDKAASKGIIHKNVASRKKSRLNKKVNTLFSKA